MNVAMELAQGGPSKEKELPVHVRHVGELERVNFKVPATATLQQVWDQAYVELEVEREQRDIFQAREGETVVDLAPYLGLTLEQANKDGLAKSRQFEIVAGTGGA